MRTDVLIEITEDLDELRFLVTGYAASLRDWRKKLRIVRNNTAEPFLLEETNHLLAKLKESTQEIDVLEKEITTRSPQSLEYYAERKAKLYTDLRISIPLIAGIITSTEWQSPSFAHSLRSEAGTQEGKIIANINDYKRDRHLNEEEYQQQFLKEYVDGIKFPTGAYLTSSGMAALTTIITFLITQKKCHGPVLIGKSIYFENTEIIETVFSEKNVITVDEMNTEMILQTYDEEKPDLLFFDSLCNAPTVAVPDLMRILKHVSEQAKKETFFIIDNSTLSVALQPLKKVRLPSKVKLIVFESLNKYHQFGLDRVTAGIVWYRGFGLENMYYARVHAGSNIPDSSVYALPKPNRKYLERRMNRLNRNATYLAKSLTKFISQRKTKKIDAIIYPGLKTHPSYSWSKEYFFQGSYFVISFRKPYQNVREYQRFVNQMIANARQKKVSINGGTSFGFNTTRVYLTARNSDYGTPFIRVSLGSENKAEIEKVKNVFEQTLQSF